MAKTHIAQGYGQTHLVYFGGCRVQAIERDRDLWFLASDLGKLLKLKNIRYNLRELKDSEKEWCYMWMEARWKESTKVNKNVKSHDGVTDSEPTQSDIEGSGVSETYVRPQRRRVRVVNESGLYRLIFMSRTPAAKAFQDWVVCDVLPMINRTGKYAHRETPEFCHKPRNMSQSEMMKISFKERFRRLEWIEPYIPSPEEQAELKAWLGQFNLKIEADKTAPVKQGGSRKNALDRL
jgi:prophage antirepressor-like protein